MTHDTMAGENRTFFSSQSGLQNNNILALLRLIFFFSVSTTLSFLAEWQQLRKHNRKVSYCSQKIQILIKRIECHLPSRLVGFVHCHCLFLETVMERGLQDEMQSTYLVTEMEVG